MINLLNKKIFAHFLEHLKDYDVKVSDPKCGEIQVEFDNITYKLFSSKTMKRFVVLKKTEHNIEIHDIKYSPKTFLCLTEFLNAFIQNRLPNISDVIKEFKLKRRANKLRRTLKGKED